MARLSRVVIPGIAHHVTQRGNRRMPTFFCDDDYRAYIAEIARGCQMAQVLVFAYCLMPNHVPLVLVPHAADGLRGALAEAHRRYALRINRRQGWQGHL
jgi:putative transposase